MSTFATPIRVFPAKKFNSSKPNWKINEDQLVTGNRTSTDFHALDSQALTQPLVTPEIPAIENRIINKELETKRVLINFIMFFVLRLINKIIIVVFQKNDNLSQLLIKYSQLYSALYKLLQIAFFWNIGSGLFKVFKPQDDFKDLNLTNKQRSLLGLPLVPLTKLEPITTTSSTVSLSPVKTTIKNVIQQDLGQQSDKFISTKESPSINKTTKNSIINHKTPIASPLSSPSPLKKTLSPRKSPTISTSSISSSSGARSSVLYKKPLSLNPATTLAIDNISTPTYIPSPKYYYRMDSPSRPKRV